MLSCFYFSVLEVTKNFLASDPLPTDIGYVVCTHVYKKLLKKCMRHFKFYDDTWRK